MTIGLLTLRHVRPLSPAERASRRVVNCMTPIEQVPTVSPSTPVTEVLPRLTHDEFGRVLVRRGHTAVGVITPGDLTRRLQRAEELGVELAVHRSHAAVTGRSG